MKEHPIQSVLDNDLYKFTMQQAFLELSPEKIVRYEFRSRNPEDKFTPEFLAELMVCIERMANIPVSLNTNWGNRLRESCPFFKPWYIEYLENYKYDPSQVNVSLDEEGQLHIVIEGPVHSAILWEVPLLALTSELYFKIVRTDWEMDFPAQNKRLRAKAETLKDCIFADFGTRRRRSFQMQHLVVGAFESADGFVGTSNVELALRHNVKPIGTMAHEFFMAISAIKGLRHANQFALEAWSKVYEGELGIALTDTFGTEAFFNDFNTEYARLYDGVRQDSGEPIEFAEKAIEHYKSLGIDPLSKVIIFSDGLCPEKAVEINEWCKGKIKCSFGIGTNFTNDFPGSPALNIVIKMTMCDGIPVVKISDSPGKAIGEADALRVAMWTFFGELPDAMWTFFGELPPACADHSESEELKFLRFFYIMSDFGPADGDVRQLLKEEYGGEIPKGYREE